MNNGRALYEGPSQFDGRPVVVVLTGLGRRSHNSKTGDMTQAWILPQGRSPAEASRAGATVTVCGGCPHRPRKEGGLGSCYVDVSRAPTSVWAAWRAGLYRPFDPSPGSADVRRLRAKPVRLGAWGDPAAVPAEVWAPVLEHTSVRAGYTHAWRGCDPRFRKFLMASCDSAAETLQARALGWRPFRVRRPDEAPMTGEFECPASAAAGHRLDCARCGACWGADDAGTRAFPGLTVHGAPNRMVAFLKGRNETPPVPGGMEV